jgi:peptidoglycan/xylan/chitin deacetylase (PgdA/CDA1 family)
MRLRDHPAQILRRVRGKFSAGAWLPVVRRLPVDGMRGAGSVGLSFDDGPAGAATCALLDVLQSHATSATFFLNGERAAAEIDVVARIVAAGHDVFAHGWRHVRYETVRPDVLVGELEQAEATLRRVRPTPSPYLVRLPYGSGHMVAGVHRALRAWNPAAQIAHWDYLTGDWTLADDCAGPEALAQACAATVERLMAYPALVGSVLLLHEKPFDVPAPMAAEIAPVFADLLLRALHRRGMRGTGMVPLGTIAAMRRYVRG